MGKQLTNEEFQLRMDAINGIYTDDIYINMHSIMNFYCDYGHQWTSFPCNIVHNHHTCPYCSGRNVIVGKTDLWTTNPEIASLLLNKNDGYLYKNGSHHHVNFVCPNCHQILNREIKSIVRQGLKCPFCSDGFSYPNKFMSNMLLQLNVAFIAEYTIRGNTYRYDFYIPQYKTIIEMNGAQHYYGWSHSVESLNEIIHNDKSKYEYAIQNNIEKYIVIDCKISSVDYISQNILKSELSSLFQLNTVDWKICGQYASNSTVKYCCELYDSEKLIKDISDILHVSRNSVTKMLKQGAEINICYYSKENMNHRKSTKRNIAINQYDKNGTFIGKFESLKIAAQFINISYNQISACLHNRAKTAGGFIWKYATDN